MNGGWSSLDGAEGGAQATDECGDGFEEPVVCGTAANVAPDSFHGVELRGIGRQEPVSQLVGMGLAPCPDFGMLVVTCIVGNHSEGLWSEEVYQLLKERQVALAIQRRRKAIRERSPGQGDGSENMPGVALAIRGHVGLLPRTRPCSEQGGILAKTGLVSEHYGRACLRCPFLRAG